MKVDAIPQTDRAISARGLCASRTGGVKGMSDGERALPVRAWGQASHSFHPMWARPVVVRNRKQLLTFALMVVLGWLTSSMPPIGTDAADAAEPRLVFAPRKVASPFRTDRPGAHLAFPDLPKRGALIATGNISSPIATWIIVDLEARTIRKATTRHSAATGDSAAATVIERDMSRNLTTSETDAVILAANTIWAKRDPASIDARGPTDALCSVALLDGNDVLHEFGAACPRAQFVHLLMALAERPQ